MTTHRGVLALALAAMAVGCAQPEPAPEASVVRTGGGGVEARAARETPVVPAGAPRIVFLGDSLTAGYGLDVRQAVPALVQELVLEHGYEYEVVARGVSGDTSAGGLSRLEYSLEGDVAVLVVELGGNDGLRGLPVASLKRNLSAIITEARARGITVLLTGMEAPTSHGAAYTSEFREAFRELADEHDVAFMPFYLEDVAGMPELNLPDGIHPNPEGSRLIAANVWAVLEPLLDVPSDAVSEPVTR